MHDFESLSMESESNIIEVPKRQRISQGALPKLMQTPSDLKPPTINSSFINCPSPFTDPVRSFISYRDSSQFDQGRKAKTLGLHDGVEVKFLDESQTKRNKKSLFNTQRSEKKLQALTDLLNTQSLSKELLDRRMVRKFSTNLLQKAQIFRESLFNPYQKELLTEKYLEQQHQYKIQINTTYFLFSDMFTSLVMLMLFFWLPFKIGFSQPSNIPYSIIVIFILITDILISFIKPYISEGKLVQQTSQIMVTYFRDQLLVDLMFLITSALILACDFQQITLWLILIVQIICSLLKIKSNLTRVSDFIPYNLDFLEIIMTLMYVIHLSACLWHFIGTTDHDSWIINLNIEGSTNYTKYCYSLYWATQVLLSIGAGEIPRANEELIFSSIIMFVSVWLLGYVISHIINPNTKAEINNLLSKRNVSMEVSARIRNYIKFIKNENKNIEMQTLVQQLSPALKEELFLQIRIQALLACKPLAKFSRSTLEHMTQDMQYLNFSPNQLIIDNTQEDDHSLYIIDTGEVQIVSQNKVLARLQSRDSFGEYSFFSNQQRKASAKATGFVQVYKVDQQKFINIVQQNKADHERFMFIRHSLIYKQFAAANLQCYSCKSQNHLIQKCSFWAYEPDFEKVYKKENFNSQIRTPYKRAIRKQRREMNQVFKKLIVRNLILQYNYDSLKIFRLKYDLIYDEDDEDDQTEDDNLESYTESSNNQSDNYSDNRPYDKQDGTIVSILKQQDVVKENSKILQEIDDENEQLFIIRPNTQKGTVSTAQFQHQNELQLQQFQQYQQLQQQQQQLYKFSLVPQEPKLVRRTSTGQEMQSSQLIANECPIPSVKKIKHTPQIVFKGETESQSGPGSRLRVNSNVKTPTINKKLSRIREEDSDTLNLSNRQQSEDQASSPYPRRNGKQSNGSSQVRQSMKRFSSKLSSIPIKSGTITQLRSTISPYTRSNIHLPTAVGMVDLSMYKRVEPAQEFDRMYAYTIYFPVSNFKNVINRVNYIRKRLTSFIPSKYTFQTRVKRLADRFAQIMQIENNPDK